MAHTSTGLESLDYRALFEHSPALFMILDPKLNILTVSDQYAAATLICRSDVAGRSLFEVFPDNPEDPNASGTANLKASLERVLKSKKSDIMAIQKYDIRVPPERGGGFEVRYWSPQNCPVIIDGEIKYIIHRVENVTEFVRLKEQGIEAHRITEELRSRADTAERIRQSQRMEAMGQLAGGVAHDFNNILNVILLNCETALGDTGLNEKIKKSFEQIYLTGKRAANLTRQLLAFSRKQVMQPKVLNINSVITDVKELLRRVVTEDIELQFSKAKDLQNTLIDQGQLEQVLMNLVVNARDAMPRGGKIKIETANVELDEGLSKGNVKVEPGPYVMVSVSDTGQGMTAEVQARLFEPFFTTKGVGKGTGLGLATVYGIVSQNKGTVWVYSEVGKGSVFKVYLPRVSNRVDELESTISKLKATGGTERILLVEDEAQLRELTSMTLANNGYSVTEANNGLEALKLLQANPGNFDLIITDVVMPEIGGKELIERVKKFNSKIKILFVSGYTEDTLGTYGLSGSHPHFLEKPFSIQNLLAKVKEALKS